SQGTDAAPEAASPDSMDAIEASRRTLAESLRQLGVESDIDAERIYDGAWCFRMPGSGAGIVIGRHGQTLDAIEYLLNRLSSHGRPSLSRITVDVEGYR